MGNVVSWMLTMATVFQMQHSVQKLRRTSYDTYESFLVHWCHRPLSFWHEFPFQGYLWWNCLLWSCLYSPSFNLSHFQNKIFMIVWQLTQLALSSANLVTLQPITSNYADVLLRNYSLKTSPPAPGSPSPQNEHLNCKQAPQIEFTPFCIVDYNHIKLYSQKFSDSRVWKNLPYRQIFKYDGGQYCRQPQPL